MLIFIILLIVRRFFIWEVDREAEFSPLKNGSGAVKDSPETCRKSILGRHALWAKAVGASFTNEERDVIEISPLVSLDGEVNISIAICTKKFLFLFNMSSLIGIVLLSSSCCNSPQIIEI